MRERNMHRRTVIWIGLLVLAHLLLAPVVIGTGMGLALTGPNDPNQSTKHTMAGTLVIAYFLPLAAVEQVGVNAFRLDTFLLAAVNTAAWCAMIGGCVAVWRFGRRGHITASTPPR